MTTDRGRSGLRERKKLETRDALAAAALRLVSLHGLAGVTVNDIADAAGVSPRTFFNYFATKEDALMRPPLDPAVLAERAASVDASAPTLDALVAIMAPDVAALEADPAPWRQRFDIVRTNPELLPRLVSVNLADEQRIVDALVERAERTGGTSRPRIEMLVAAVLAVSLRVMMRWHAAGSRGPLLTEVGAAIDALRAELSPATDPFAMAGPAPAPADSASAADRASAAEPAGAAGSPGRPGRTNRAAGTRAASRRASAPDPTSPSTTTTTVTAARDLESA